MNENVWGWGSMDPSCEFLETASDENFKLLFLQTLIKK